MYYISKDEYEIKFDVYKSDVFIIGLIILEMASTIKSDKFYNFTNRSINM